MRRALLLAVVVSAMISGTAVAAAKITIKNNDAASVGFNDPTPATPVGGNSGTTIGDQRLNAFKEAAAIWGRLIDSPVEIVIDATWQALSCTDTGATLGSAGPVQFFADFDGAPLPNTWYPSALANKYAGRDLDPSKSDIVARFNLSLGTSTCNSLKWYYGLDGNHGDDEDLVVVLLHEFAHGLGFSGSTSSSTGALLGGRATFFENNTLDLTTGQRWTQLTDAQRLTSATNTGNLVWAGGAVKAAALDKLNRYSGLTIQTPASLAGQYDVGPAIFGPPLSTVALNGPIIQALDAANTDGPTETDGCSPFVNAAQVAGKIALIDRGTCTFVNKVLNAQAAGAVGVVVVDNDKTACKVSGLGGTDATIRIPAVRVTAAVGDRIKAELANGVSALLGVNQAFQSASSATGLIRLYAPCAIEAGSSIYHWDTVADPNLLMEPNISPDLGHGVDLTLNQLMDMGWSRPANQGPPPGRRALKRGR